MENQLIDKWGEWIDVASLAIGDSDVYYTFSGKIACSLKGGKNNPLFGKRINLSKMYDTILCDVIKYIQSDEYLLKDNKRAREDINHYVTVKHGISFEWIYNLVNGNNDKKSWVRLKTDILFDEWIRYNKGDISGIDWLKIYRNFEINTNKNEVLIYIANNILKGSIYEYFVDRYNLRVDGIDCKDRTIEDKLTGKRASIIKSIVLKYNTDDGGYMKRLIPLGAIQHNKRDWWTKMTQHSASKDLHGGRHNIMDYDVLLSGRNEDDVLPNRCPIDNSIILNYTGIDFSNKNNFNEIMHNNGKNETWSFASIDRIDSTKKYAYDNIQIISHYYNGLKNCASNEQISKLYNHQIKLKSELCSIEYMI